VRRLVRFQRGNILSAECLPETGIYDFVFCRNLLIYFDRPTQTATLAKLRRLLVPRGALFTGSAELPLALEHGFLALNLPRGFACRRAEPAHSPAPNVRPDNSPAAKPAARVHLPVAIVPDAAVAPAAARPTRLARARELAVQGQFAEAQMLCESHLREDGASSEAYFIMGLVQDAAGEDEQAVECYRKALYLEPGHLDALHQWASLSERNGRPDQATRLRQRAVRRMPQNTAETWTP
jgi:chemotaxis protein methyltransferase WspC